MDTPEDRSPQFILCSGGHEIRQITVSVRISPEPRLSARVRLRVPRQEETAAGITLIVPVKDRYAALSVRLLEAHSERRRKNGNRTSIRELAGLLDALLEAGESLLEPVAVVGRHLPPGDRRAAYAAITELTDAAVRLRGRRRMRGARAAGPP